MKQYWLFTWILALPLLGNVSSEVCMKSNYNQPDRINDILVLSVAGNEDSAAALCMERKLVKELKSFNYAAESAIEHFGKNAFATIREEETVKQLYPYDAVIIITLGNENQLKSRRPSECDNFFWEYYDSMYNMVHDPDLKKTGNYFWEISFFQINCWKLQYRMRSTPFSFNQVNTLIARFSAFIIRDMRNKNIIRPIPERLKPF